jgi:hypothetical protein
MPLKSAIGNRISEDHGALGLGIKRGEYQLELFETLMRTGSTRGDAVTLADAERRERRPKA